MLVTPVRAACFIKIHFQFPKNNCGVAAGFGRNVNLDTSNWAEIHYPVKLHPCGCGKHVIDYLIPVLVILSVEKQRKHNRLFIQQPT